MIALPRNPKALLAKRLPKISGLLNSMPVVLPESRQAFELEYENNLEALLEEIHGSMDVCNNTTYCNVCNNKTDEGGGHQRAEESEGALSESFGVSQTDLIQDLERIRTLHGGEMAKQAASSPTSAARATSESTEGEAGANATRGEAACFLLSHAHDALSLELAKRLTRDLWSRAGIQVVDMELLGADGTGNSLWYDACEKADGCLPLLSEPYAESAECESQFTFSKDNRKFIIPLVVDTRFNKLASLFHRDPRKSLRRAVTAVKLIVSSPKSPATLSRASSTRP